MLKSFRSSFPVVMMLFFSLASYNSFHISPKFSQVLVFRPLTEINPVRTAVFSSRMCASSDTLRESEYLASIVPEAESNNLEVNPYNSTPIEDEKSRNMIPMKSFIETTTMHEFKKAFTPSEVSELVISQPVDTKIMEATPTNGSLFEQMRFPRWHSPRGQDGELIREITAGSISALVTIPTSIAYATIIGLNPLIGIWSSVFVNSGVAIVGGAPGLIAGAAGVVAVPLSKLVATYGTQTMGITVLLAGFFEMLFGLLKLGKIAEVVTEPVMTGFLNAFAIFLMKSQLKVFYYGGKWLPIPQLQAAVSIATLCIATIRMAPKITKKIPPSLLGLVVSYIASTLLKLPVKTLSDIAGKTVFAGGLSALPSFHGFPFLPTSLVVWKAIISTAAGVALISILETLLANRIACNSYRCQVDVYEEDNPDRSCVGLGLGTSISSLFGGFGGCGLIPNTLLNGKSGGEGYASGFAFSAFLSFAVVALAPIIGLVPMAGLAGLMATVAFNTAEWAESWHIITHAKKSPQRFLDCLGMILTTYLCYTVDMGVGVFAGVLVTKAIDILKSMKNLSSKFMKKKTSQIISANLVL